MEAQVKLPKDEAASLMGAVTGFADRAARQSDRWWLAVLMLIGIIVCGFILKWHREDQKAIAELFSTTIKANTEALTRMTAQMERVERELQKREK